MAKWMCVCTYVYVSDEIDLYTFHQFFWRLKIIFDLLITMIDCTFCYFIQIFFNENFRLEENWFQINFQILML